MDGRRERDSDHDELPHSARRNLTMGAYSIILADDHVLVRQGLKRILEEMPGLEVVGEANDGLELLALLSRRVPDMVILDIFMPNLRGIEAIYEIKKIRPEVKILILTMHKDKEYLYLALSAGAKGYLLKEDADKELFSAIEKVQQGKTYISPHFSEEIVDDLVQVGRGDAKTVFEVDPLTPREREVLKLIAEGKSSKEIAQLLFISVPTANNHRANIMGKLGLNKATDLVKYAIRKGYV
jgi:DNA-binding NarL/FixJ family response regulator